VQNLKSFGQILIRESYLLKMSDVQSA